MITLDLFEKKLSQLNQQHVSKTKDLEKAMHSQGIDPGEPKRDAHHVQYPKATFRRTGKPAHGITAVDDGKGKLTSSTGGNTVRDAVLKSGRVDKRPAAKAKRKAEAEENRAAKKKNRDPFTREHTEWWVEMWRLDEGRDAKARAQRKFDRENTAIVKVPGSERTQKETSGIARKSGPGVRVPEKQPETKTSVSPSVQPKKKEKKYASADQIRDRKFRDYKADRKDKKRRQAEADKRSKQARADSEAKDNLEKRKSGIGGGIKSALGGDVIGMRGKKGESGAEKEARQDMNKKNRGDFSKKKVQQTGNAAKSAASYAGKSLLKGPDKVDPVSSASPETNSRQTRGYQSSAG